MKFLQKQKNKYMEENYEVKKMLDFLGRDFNEEKKKMPVKTYKRSELWKSISRNVEENIAELEKEDFSVKELEGLKACYEAESNDSLTSIANILAVPAIVIAALEAIKKVSEVILQESVILGVLKAQSIMDMVCSVGAVIIVISALCRVITVCKENSRFRNRIMAISILLAKREEKTEEDTKEK